MSTDPVTIGLVGLGFGAEFIPIYQAHPDAAVGGICRRDSTELDRTGNAFGIDKRYTEYADLLADESIDAIHINSPIADHGWMTLRALEAGKHVCCTVPMATTIDDCERICDAVRATGLVYMMAETVVFSREYLFIKDLYTQGELGRIQYLQASHPQDMAGWPSYWESMVPMHYATHVVSPILALVDCRAERISCFGSGRVEDRLARSSGCPFAVESCHLTLRGSDAIGHVWRSLFDTARQYRESLNVYGSRRSFEWSLIEGEAHVLHVAKRPEPEIPQRVEVPDFADRLPEPLRQFTHTVQDAEHRSFLQGAGHGGSHPHIAHAFVQALLGAAPAWPDARTAANWTCVGLCAHHSAMNGGRPEVLPAFTLES